MKKTYPMNSLFNGMKKRLGLGLVTCLSICHLSSAQTTGVTVVSTTTENGITTKTLSNGTIVKTVADGYYLDTAFYKNSNVLKETKVKKYWKFTDRIGVATSFTKDGEDQSLYLKSGGYNSLSANHFWGIFGLGLTGGYQYFNVKDEYQNYPKLLATLNGLDPNALKFSKVSPYQDFYLLAGPAIAVPLGKKFSLDFDLKAGFFNSKAASFGATALWNGFDRTISRVSPSANTWHAGGLLNIDLLYSLSKNWAIGLNVQGFSTKTDYITEGREVTTPLINEARAVEFTRTNGGCNFGLAISHTFGNTCARTVYTLLPPPPAPVICNTPTLVDGSNGKMYENGSTEKPSFKWKSTSPAPENEEYIFKLYRADGSGVPIYSQTTKASSLDLPANVSLVSNDESSFYYYTIQSSQEGKCLSEAAAASFGYKAKPVQAISATKPAEDQYIFKIFGGSTATKYFNGGSGSGRRKASHKVVAKPAETVAKPKTVVPKRKVSGVSKTTTIVNYENVATNPNIKWPADLPLPKQPSVYEYEVQRLSTGDCKPTGQVAKYKFYIDPKNPSDIRIIPDKPKRR
ncbi:hypothetical protein SAMN04515674_112175 [Pseudarcicella hirudinis]|uniref:Uncharacterized protein n=1 Tax=Pseudarcicella hirudinis TaxID=1079859 RepID=A0A1I5WU90_9BACT|nr:hypothetical protein [Pseudarcicella hirudinis]SFQ23066.1 hypothetical protein SAMN04515674_112175 [Pseudarcicella hirudinis]